MNVVSALTVRRNLGEILNRVFYKKEHIFVERSGKIIAKLVPVENASASAKNVHIYAGIWDKKIAAIMKHASLSMRKKRVKNIAL